MVDGTAIPRRSLWDCGRLVESPVTRDKDVANYEMANGEGINTGG